MGHLAAQLINFVVIPFYQDLQKALPTQASVLKQRVKQRWQEDCQASVPPWPAIVIGNKSPRQLLMVV